MLTDTKCRNAKPAGKPYKLADGKGLYLEDVYVKPAYRRQGIGRALLIHLARIAVARGCGRFEWSVLDWNAPAIQFYEGLGATVMPEWRIVRVTGEALGALAAKKGSL